MIDVKQEPWDVRRNGWRVAITGPAGTSAMLTFRNAQQARTAEIAMREEREAATIATIAFLMADRRVTAVSISRIARFAWRALLVAVALGAFVSRVASLFRRRSRSYFGGRCEDYSTTPGPCAGCAPAPKPGLAALQARERQGSLK